jgi:hypothetical protein
LTLASSFSFAFAAANNNANAADNATATATATGQCGLQWTWTAVAFEPVLQGWATTAGVAWGLFAGPAAGVVTHYQGQYSFFGNGPDQFEAKKGPFYSDQPYSNWSALIGLFLIIATSINGKARP